MRLSRGPGRLRADPSGAEPGTPARARNRKKTAAANAGGDGNCEPISALHPHDEGEIEGRRHIEAKETAQRRRKATIGPKNDATRLAWSRSNEDGLQAAARPTMAWIKRADAGRR